MARTPKGKKGGPGSNRADGGKKLRRKAAMQGGKTLLKNRNKVFNFLSFFPFRQEDEEDLDGVGWGRHKGRSEGPSEPERHIHHRGQGC